MEPSLPVQAYVHQGGNKYIFNIVKVNVTHKDSKLVTYER